MTERYIYYMLAASLLAIAFVLVGCSDLRPGGGLIGTQAAPPQCIQWVNQNGHLTARKC